MMNTMKPTRSVLITITLYTTFIIGLLLIVYHTGSMLIIFYFILKPTHHKCKTQICTVKCELTLETSNLSQTETNGVYKKFKVNS